MSEAEESLAKAEELLERLRLRRDELEKLAAGEDADAAVDVLADLAEIAKEVELELTKARDRANAQT